VGASKKADKSNKEIAKRQNIIDLHAQWSNISDIDLNNIIVPDVVKAVGVLTLTASLWNHDVVLKPLIYQSYWNSYRTLYDKLYSFDQEIPGTGWTGKSLVADDITKAYYSMKNTDISKLLNTKY